MGVVEIHELIKGATTNVIESGNAMIIQSCVFRMMSLVNTVLGSLVSG